LCSIGRICNRCTGFVAITTAPIRRTRNVSKCLYSLYAWLITFRVSRRPRKMYCGHARLCVCVSVCLSAAECLHYCTDPDVTWGSGRDAPSCALLSEFAIGARDASLWQHYGNAWQSPAVIRQAQRTPHALICTHARTSDKIDAPAACATLSATRPFDFVHTARVLQREREMLASTCLYSLYA